MAAEKHSIFAGKPANLLVIFIIAHILPHKKVIQQGKRKAKVRIIPKRTGATEPVT